MPGDEIINPTPAAIRNLLDELVQSGGQGMGGHPAIERVERGGLKLRAEIALVEFKRKQPLA